MTDLGRQRSARVGFPRVVVIDDDSSLRAMLLELLQPEFDVYVEADALNGILAVHDKCPDAIVLDLEMPGFGGWDVVRTLRDDPRTRDTKIVILTARTDAGLSERAAIERCSFLTKPLREDSVVDELAAMLRKV